MNVPVQVSPLPAPTGRPQQIRTTPQHLLVSFVLLVTSMLVTVQFRTEQTIQRTLGIATPQLQELGFRLRRAEAARQTLEQQVVMLREQVAAVIEAVGEEQEGLRQMTAEIDELRALAGLTPVAGPGVVVEIRDSVRKPAPDQDPNDVLVHYTDLQAVVNDLWAAGAEAIAINDERLTVASSIQCVGTTVLVNRRRMAPPFRIVAIGDAAVLEAYMVRRGGVVGLLRAYGFPVQVSRHQRLTLPAYRGPIPAAGQARP